LTVADAIVVGAGALGSPAATYLAAAGVGRIGVVDGAAAESSDSQRASLLWPPDVDSNRAEAVAAKVGLLGADTQAEPYPVDLEEANARAIVVGSQLVLDCSGDPRTRRLVTDACCAERIDTIVADVSGLSGQLLATRPGETACWRCVHASEEPGEAAGERGMLGALAGVIGSLQALAAIELLTGVGELPTDRLVEVHGDGLRQEAVSVSRRPDCPACAGLEPSPQSSER
jgi:molybdopterin-synthase adenylyltransferase